MHPKQSILGKTSHTSTVRELLQSAEEGMSLTLHSIPSGARVSLVNRRDPDGNPELELEILVRDGTFDPVAKLSQRLEVLQIPFSVEVRGRVASASSIRLCLSGAALAGEMAGRMVDLALSEAGLRPGDEYTHRFGDDTLDEEVGSHPLRDRNAGACVAGTRPERRLLDRILGYLR